MKTGTSTGGIETSARYRRRRAAARRAEEKAWAERSGPVTVRRRQDDGLDVEQAATVDGEPSSSSPPR